MGARGRAGEYEDLLKTDDSLMTAGRKRNYFDGREGKPSRINGFF
jgi:hypothetical protein